MSEISLEETISYLKIDELDIDETEKMTLCACLEASKDYVKSYTGLTNEECDEHESLSLAVLILCADMYENRTRDIASSAAAPNKTLDAILGFYSRNLLG